VTQSERDHLLAAFLEGMGSLETKVGMLTERVDGIETSVEEVRKNAKGANNWGKIASGAAAAAPLLTAAAKGLGWI
jgi:hypothetical protein